MSMSLQLYLEKIDEKVIKNLKKKMKEYYSIDLEIHPEFNFDDQSGYLPMKVKLLDKSMTKVSDKWYSCGFELDVRSFNYTTNDVIDRELLEGEYRDKASQAKKYIEISYGFYDILTPILAIAFSRTLAEVGGGIIFECEAGEFYFPEEFPDSNQKEMHEMLKNALESNEEIEEFEDWE